MQGAVVTVKMRMSRWRCANGDCERLTFVDRPSESVSPYARRTGRIAELVHFFGHGVGGKPAERLLKRLGMPVSDDTILRQLKRRVAARCGAVTVRVAGIDDWSWRRGCSYGTIVVDLERRVVVDVLADRSAAGTADWLCAHPEVEIISRDRSGLYAQGGREGAHRRDRSLIAFICFKICESRLKPNSAASTGRLPSSKDEDESAATIVSNPRGRSDVAKHRKLTRQAQRRSRQAIYDQIRTLRDAGTSIRDIAKETGFCTRSVRKWLKFPRRGGREGQGQFPFRRGDHATQGGD